MDTISEPNNKINISPENTLIDAVEYLYKFINTVYTDNITPSNVIIITTQLVQLVEKYKTLTGYQKKMIVINVIKKLVNTHINSEDDKWAMNMIIDNTIPSVIDNLVSAINGNLKFNKNENNITCFKKYICCCI